VHTQKDKAGEALQAMKDENREHGEDEAVLEVVQELLPQNPKTPTKRKLNINLNIIFINFFQCTLYV